MATGRGREKSRAKDAPPAKRVVEPEVIAEDEPVEDAELEDPEAEAEDDEEEETSSAMVAAQSGPILDVGSQGASPSTALVRTGATAASAPGSVARRSGALDQFLRTVGRYPVLNAEQERELALAVHERKDPVAARKLVVHNLRLVVKMAYKYRRTWANVLDLIQEGNIGLVEAVSRFDPFKGARFSTYAMYWIRAYMIRYLLEYSRMVRISRTRAGRKMFFRLSKERERLRALGIEPGPKLLAATLGVSEEDFNEVARHMDQAEVRLDAPLSRDGDSSATMLDTLSGEGMSPETAYARKDFTEDVTKVLDAFARDQLKDERERAAWAEHLMAEEPISLSDLGERFGVTKQRMGQIVNGIRARLKDYLVEEMGPDVKLAFVDER